MNGDRPTSRRIRLREFELTDLDGLHAIYGDSRVTEHLSFEPRSRQEVALIVSRAIAELQTRPRRTYTYAAEEMVIDEMIGVVRFDRMGIGSARLGFALRPDAWGAGYGRECVARALDLGFREPSAGGLGLHEVTAARAPENNGSARLMHSLGFVDDGLVDIPTASGSRPSPECSITAGRWAGRSRR